MSPHFRKATGWSAFSNSRIATRRSLSLAHVASGIPERSAASRKACFSALESRSSIYSSSGFSFFGRPRFAMPNYCTNKKRVSQAKILLDKPPFWGYSNCMNRLSRDKQVQVLKSLIEGNSIRATVRLTGAAKDTVIKLLVAAGSACADYQDRALRNIKSKRI